MPPVKIIAYAVALEILSNLCDLNCLSCCEIKLANPSKLLETSSQDTCTCSGYAMLLWLRRSLHQMTVTIISQTVHAQEYEGRRMMGWRRALILALVTNATINQ
jgi:hypothetical protein